MLIRFSDIANQLAGISTPIGGANWQPGTPDVEVARRVLSFLEDRRVLYDPLEVEVPQQCVESVLRISEFLTDELAKQGIGNELAGHLRAMGAACRRFLDHLRSPDKPSEFYLPHGDTFMMWQLNQALGELRAMFGIHLAQIAAKHRLDVEEPLSYVIQVALPALDEEE